MLVVGVSGERKTVEGSEEEDVDARGCFCIVGVDSAAALTSPLSSGGVISTSCACADSKAAEVREFFHEAKSI